MSQINYITNDPTKEKIRVQHIHKEMRLLQRELRKTEMTNKLERECITIQGGTLGQIVNTVTTMEDQIMASGLNEDQYELWEI